MAQAIKRLGNEHRSMMNPNNRVCDYFAEPLDDNIYEWHFTIRGPLADHHNAPLAFRDGIYHGTLTFPLNYPFAPPDIVFFTPNGRFKLHQKICSTISSFHKELWRPTYDIGLILIALRLFMGQEDEPGIGGLGKSSSTEKDKAEMATKSWDFTCPKCKRAVRDVWKQHMEPYPATTAEKVAEVPALPPPEKAEAPGGAGASEAPVADTAAAASPVSAESPAAPVQVEAQEEAGAGQDAAEPTPAEAAADETGVEKKRDSIPCDTACVDVDRTDNDGDVRLVPMPADASASASPGDERSEPAQDTPRMAGGAATEHAFHTPNRVDFSLPAAGGPPAEATASGNREGREEAADGMGADALPPGTPMREGRRVVDDLGEEAHTTVMPPDGVPQQAEGRKASEKTGDETSATGRTTATREAAAAVAPETETETGDTREQQADTHHPAARTPPPPPAPPSPPAAAAPTAEEAPRAGTGPQEGAQGSVDGSSQDNAARQVVDAREEKRAPAPPASAKAPEAASTATPTAARRPQQRQQQQQQQQATPPEDVYLHFFGLRIRVNDDLLIGTMLNSAVIILLILLRRAVCWYFGIEL